jgi:putative ABC transport system permease protein
VQGASYEAVAKVPGPWSIEAQKSFPEIQHVARFVFFNEVLVSRGEKRFYESGGFFADSTVFEVFSFALLKGNPQTALVPPNAIVVTEAFAQKYFGNEDPLGQTLTFDNQEQYLVTGVMGNVPTNSHFTFDFLVSMATYANPRRDNWEWLQDFAYRIELGWWTFALAGGIALLIALLTVSTQAIKAAPVNPVEALRYE